jgi:hypothetical protein
MHASARRNICWPGKARERLYNSKGLPRPMMCLVNYPAGLSLEAKNPFNYLKLLRSNSAMMRSVRTVEKR